MLETIGIGSLPHTQRELGIQYSFRYDIPFLPELPKSSSMEFMIPLALRNVPGFTFDEDGMPTLNETVWKLQRLGFLNHVNRALTSKNYNDFLPLHRCLHPFLFDVKERHVKQAKMQMVGPITIHWLTKNDELLPYLLTRASAMIQEFKDACPETDLIFFVDEPALYAYDFQNPLHKIELQKLKTFLMHLKKLNVKTGLHCCSNTAWNDILDLPLDYLSFDFRLSFSEVMKAPKLSSFLNSGKLVLGIIPTTGETHPPEEMIAEMGELAPIILKNSLLSPACGLGLQDMNFCEQVLKNLDEYRHFFFEYLASENSLPIDQLLV